MILPGRRRTRAHYPTTYDPLVLTHARALMPWVPGAEPCTCIDADVRDPAALLAAAGTVLDFTRPVAVLLLALLHFLPDADDPAAIVAQFAAALAPGSLIAISHLTADQAPQAITDSATAYNAKVPCQVYPRTRDQIEALCGEFPIRHPGVVPVNFWLPSLREPASPAVDLHAAVIRLPVPAEPHRAQRATPSPQEQAAELARRAAQFPGHDLAREDTGNGPKYVARARDLGIHPSLVMTATLDDLCAQLAPAPQP